MQALIHWLAPGTAPIDRAIRRGWEADGVGSAFLPAYRAALQTLIPALPEGAEACLCVTEEHGNHPRAIQTTLSDGLLNGTKVWTTGAESGRLFLVAAKVGEAEGRPVLKLVRVRADAPGVTLAPMPPTPFVPEVSHSSVSFADVAVSADDVLPGDGYTDYIKPFRTVEDIHVFAALAAWWLGVGTRAGWPDALRGEIAHVLVSLRRLAEADPGSPATHIALGGVIHAQTKLLESMEPCWQAVEPELYERWKRDRAIMHVAGKARTKRFERAMAAIG